jgi:signal transduction histidine kinase
MSIQKKLYASAERKLVLWCIVTMLLMSISVILTAYIVTTRWLEQYANSLSEIPRNHGDLVIALIAVQVMVLTIGIALSFVFARRALRPIRQAHQAQADFAANAHHQLRTPIAVMQAEVDTALLRKNQQPHNYKHVLKSLLDELSLLRTTSEQLLLRADGVPANGKSHPTSEDMADLTVMLKRRYNLQISTNIAPELYTSISQEELAICLETLLDNSKKYAGKSPEDLETHITLEQYGSAVQLTYHDNGKGIAAGEEKHIFERYFRGKRAVKSQIQGNGLGLAILADAIKAHKGTLAAANLPHGGLQVVISLPLATKR